MSETYRYREYPIPTLGTIKRPVLDVDFFSERTVGWLSVIDILVDTGADFTIVSWSHGLLLTEHPDEGEELFIEGIASEAHIPTYLHSFRMRFCGFDIIAPVLVSASDNVRPVLGRHGALDRFIAEFHMGEELRIHA